MTFFRNLKKNDYVKGLTLAPSQFSRFPDITTSLSVINYYALNSDNH